LGPLAQLRTKTKGDPNVDAKTLANAVAAAAAASATVESRRLLKKGEFDKRGQMPLLNITWGIG
jgi:hypothetical protein